MSTPTRRKRTNAEILADMKAERASAPKKRHRRTKAEIARDAAHERRMRAVAAVKARAEAEPVREATSAPSGSDEPRKTTVYFKEQMTALGFVWEPGQWVVLEEGGRLNNLAYDRNGKFIFDQTPDEQVATAGRVRYEVREE